ncbi:putative MFS family arabinose efflux permease [Pseudonocardia sediminis]|uniref:Putative MFS family arabinose efflux permease n=1 Tax=Pseudonocardia sediminis TaxID=1397368 RepID=A0A4Q7UYS2_PSEST|nr:MFS transporter [Pseudonocardia sediminis]RZT85403.1 putative MFS family arabinose efflux permease [Pseudonocardia sediminis]
MTEQTTSATGPGRTERRARIGVALVFGTNGLVFANLLPRYPQIKDSLGLSNTAMGIAVAAFPLGALLAGLAAGVLVARFRSSRVSTFGMAGIGVGVVLVAVSPTWALLTAAMFLAGAADAIVDVAQNAHGLRVQRRYGRSILNSFHAVWSIGAVLGGLMGSAAAGLAIPLPVHLGVSSAIAVVVALAVYPLLLPGPEDGERTGPAPAGRRPWSGLSPRVLVLILAFGLVAICGTLVEDSGQTWAAIYLQGSLGAAAAVAGLGFVALQGCQFVGRLLGDRMVDRFGQRAMARTGGVLVAGGMGLALAFPTVLGTIAGFGVAGFGVATLVPGAMTAADELPGLAPGTGLTLVTWLMRVGFLVSPPVVGIVADAVGLRVGLLVVPLAGVVVFVLAGVLARRRRAAAV